MRENNDISKESGRQLQQPVRPYIAVIGKRAFYNFFLVTLLAGGILAATNIVSKYAVKDYADDQLEHLPWDSTIFQSGNLPSFGQIQTSVSRIQGVSQVENIGLLRVQLIPQTPIEIGGKRVHLSWFSLMSASQVELLLPQLRPTEGPVLALLGPQKIIQPYLEEVGAGDSVAIKYLGTQGEVSLFESVAERVVHVSRQDLIKWMLKETGSSAFIPQLGVILVLPMDRFSQEVDHFDRIFRRLQIEGAVEEDLHQMGVTYTPEIMHLVRLDRSSLLATWDLSGSRERAAGVLEQVRDRASELSFGIGLKNDLLTTLDSIIRTDRLIGIASVLIAMPILWMAWVLAWNLAGLVSLNERRTIGLLRLRGSSSRAIGRSLLFCISFGGILGGGVGIVLGTAIPMLAYHQVGSTIPLAYIHKIQNPGALALFVVVSALLGLFAGRRVTKYASSLSPVEASARLHMSEASSFSPRLNDFQLLALVFGSYKVVAWVTGYSPEFEPLRTVDYLLNFMGAPLFIYGAIALLVSRKEVIRMLLAQFAGFLAGRFNWFVVESMISRPHRIAGALLIGALMFCIGIYPDIVAKSFFDNTTRKVKVRDGAAVGVELSMAELAGGELSLRSVVEHLEGSREALDEVLAQINRIDAVRDVSILYEMLLPSVFIVGHEGLPLYLLESPGPYIDHVYYEDGVSFGREFREAVERLGASEGSVIVSQGYSVESNLKLGDFVRLGPGVDGTEDSFSVVGVVSVLPGAPHILLESRESYAGAEVDFLRYLSQSEPFVVASAENESIRRLATLGSRAMFLVNTEEGADVLEVKALLEGRLRDLGYDSLSVKTLREDIENLSKDMFVSVAIQNTRIYFVGGLTVALCGILSIAMTNFRQIRRTFGMARVRGASPRDILRISSADFFAPTVLGAVVGVMVAMVAAYGLTDELLQLSQEGIWISLPVRLVIAGSSWATFSLLLVFFAVTGLVFGLWVFRKTPREMMVD